MELKKERKCIEEKQTHVRVNSKLTDTVRTPDRSRQEDSLIPTLLKIVFIYVCAVDFISFLRF